MVARWAYIIISQTLIILLISLATASDNPLEKKYGLEEISTKPYWCTGKGEKTEVTKGIIRAISYQTSKLTTITNEELQKYMNFNGIHRAFPAEKESFFGKAIDLDGRSVFAGNSCLGNLQVTGEWYSTEGGYTFKKNAIITYNSIASKAISNEMKKQSNSKAKSPPPSLFKSVRRNEITKVKELIDAGADINARDKNDLTPLHIAALKGHDELAEVLIQAGADVNAENEHGVTPLHAAALRGQKNVGEILIQKGANVNSRLVNDGSTPLHGAVVKGHIEFAELLIVKGADINAKNKHGDTPLHITAWTGNEQLAQMLVNRGADINAADQDGLTPQQIASNKGHLDVVTVLQRP